MRRNQSMKMKLNYCGLEAGELIDRIEQEGKFLVIRIDDRDAYVKREEIENFVSGTIVLCN